MINRRLFEIILKNVEIA